MIPVMLIVMGVSGSGKTTVGTLLAGRLRREFRDADSFHPPANVGKMRAGHALTDEDRRPWLEAIAAWIDMMRREGRRGVVTCSALKRRYRDALIGEREDVRLVYLKADEELIAKRVARRKGHFMPPALLRSQFETLEEPGPDERPVTVSVDGTPDEVVDRIVAKLQSAVAPGS